MIIKPLTSHPAVFRRMSLAQQLVAALQGAIRSGELSGELPSERALCERYRASRPVVREAIGLLEAGGVVERRIKHRARILQSSSIGADPSPGQAALIFASSVMELSHWHLLLVDALRKELQVRGIPLEVVFETRLAASRLPAKRLERLCADLSAGGVNRWILGGASRAAQEWFRKQELRTVLMGNAFPDTGLPFVNDDLRGTTRHAAGVFLGMGHQKIAYLHRQRKSAGETEETQGFLSAFLPAASSTGYVVPHSGSVSAIRQRLEGVFSGTAGITALLVSHAEDMLVVMNWCMERGIRIPQDLSLISYQWESYLDRMHPIPASYYSDPKVHARKLSYLLINPTPGVRSPKPIFPLFRRNQTVAQRRV